MKERFLQLHILTAYPPSNPNRDDMGRPKTAVVGGAMRLRISSQSLKRAWRTSDIFQSTLEGNIGKRTKAIGEELVAKMVDGGITEAKALSWAEKMIEKFGKIEKSDSKKSESKIEDSPDQRALKEESKKDQKKSQQKARLSQLVHFSPEEEKALWDLVDILIDRKTEPAKNELDSLLKIEIQAADIALFGRMLADSPKYNQEAAAQVAHAITTHKVAVEEDFFTAVDDLNKREEDRGSSHLGITEFSSGLFYTYVCINREQLIKNLQGNEELAAKTLQSFVEAIATVAPSGKQNSFASHVRASYILAEIGNQQPRSLSLAFQSPVIIQNDVLSESVNRLLTSKKEINDAYGNCSDKEKVLFVGNEGTLEDIKSFVVG